jgi:hypothetical protein
MRSTGISCNLNSLGGRWDTGGYPRIEQLQPCQVGVGGSNPLARSRFSTWSHRLRTVLADRFLLPRSRAESRGSRGEAAESVPWVATGCHRHNRSRFSEVWHDPRQAPFRDDARVSDAGKVASWKHDPAPIASPVASLYRPGAQRYALLPATRIGSTSRRESGNRTNPWAA